MLTTVLYAIGASKNSYANSFYSAAVQAGTHSWKAMFFGSLDASNFVTVDKPPFALWVMEISTRIFGFHSWSMLLPEVLSGTATVYLVYASVRRWFGAHSATLAAAVMALTPVAALMFGFNNPDAVLTLLLTASLYSFTRAIEAVSPLKWLALTGILSGCAFNTKMLQGFFVLPVLAVVYLLCAPPRFLTRLKYLAITALPTAAATLWWPTIVWLVPAANRPYIGSSTNNSIWNLIFGYNGFGRLLGNSSGQGGGMGTGARLAGNTANRLVGAVPAGGFGGGRQGPGGSGFGGSTGVFRMFNSDFGPNIAWFIVLALLGAGLVLWLTRRAPRTDRTRIAVLAWGGYALIHIALFSIVGGVIHPYYPVAMAPALAAVVGITVPYMVAEYRRASNAALVLPVAVAATGIVACILLGYQTDWWPWLRWTVLVTALISASGLIIQLITPLKRLAAVWLVTAAMACAASPVAFALTTVTVPHTGSVPTAGPAATGLRNSNNQSASAETAFITYLEAHRGNAKWLVAVASANESAPIQISSGQPVMAVGGFNGSDDALSVSQLQALVASGQLRYYAVAGSGQTGGTFGRGNSAVISWVEAHGTIVNYGGSSYTLYDLAP